MNNPWCESCSSKNVCYTSITKPKCYTPITNTGKWIDAKLWNKEDGQQMMTIEDVDKFFDTLKILVSEHPIVADWWVEIMDRYDDILQKKGADDEDA